MGVGAFGKPAESEDLTKGVEKDLAKGGNVFPREKRRHSGHFVP